MIVIRGGALFTEHGFVDGDVVIMGSDIVEIGEAENFEAATVIDAAGCLVGPGFVDVHVHFREPGQTWKEDIESGSRSAAAGGFTGVVVMPNTEPATDSVELTEEIRARGREVGLVQLDVAAALTVGRSGVMASEVEKLYDAGVRLFSDDGDSIQDEAMLHAVMERLAALPDAVVSQHAEDSTMTEGGHMHEGEMSARLGIRGLPSEAETRVVKRDLRLARNTGAAYHCQHVSAAETVEMIRQAKDQGLAVTAEVTPHHLTFDDTQLEDLDTNLKMYPPIRTARDRDALRDGLNDGTIDMVATDHAPHTTEEKAVDFTEAPRGVIGLETAAAAVNDVVSDSARLFEVMSVAPALLADMDRQGRPVEIGEPANLVVFDPNSSWIPERFESKSANSPFHGRKMRGRVRATIYEGRITYLQEDMNE